MHTAIDPTNLHYCSVQSLSKDEPLFGNAPQTDLWLILEYPHPPGDKALKESNLPDEVKSHLSNLQKSITNSRLLLVRNQLTSGKDNHSFFIAYANRNNPCLYEIQIDDYMQLLSIDETDIKGEAFTLPHRLVNERLILICTNGKRDPCCIKWGLPTFNAIASESEYSLCKLPTWGIVLQLTWSACRTAFIMAGSHLTTPALLSEIIKMVVSISITIAGGQSIQALPRQLTFT
jgi:hypothetical protein